MPFSKQVGVTQLSQLSINADLVMGAHNITLGAGQTVDGVDVSGHQARHVSGGSDALAAALAAVTTPFLVAERLKKYLSTWIEADPSSRLVTSEKRVTFTGLLCNDARTMVYAPVDALSGNFSINFEMYFTAMGANRGVGIGVANNPNGRFYIAEGVTGIFVVNNTGTSCRVGKYTNGVETHLSDAITTATSTLYYCTLSRSGNTVTLSVYTDAARTIHETGSPVTLTETTIATYDFIIVAANSGEANANTSSGYFQNLIW